jgi:transposase
MLPVGVRILVCTTQQDMRKSFDTLAAVARDVMGEEPQSGALFVFLGKSPTRVKVLWFDKNGYCVLAKRLHRAVFVPPRLDTAKGGALRIDADGLAKLLVGVTRENSHKGRLQ